MRLESPNTYAQRVMGANDMTAAFNVTSYSDEPTPDLAS
jgi:hypothetical protein